MNKKKSILSRAISVLLTVLMLVSSFAIGITASAAEVQLASVGFNIPKCTIYFDNSTAKWTNVYLMVGHNSYAARYSMTRVTGTQYLYSFTFDSAWNNATAFYFTSVGSGYAENINKLGHMSNLQATHQYTSAPSASTVFKASGTSSGTYEGQTKTYYKISTSAYATYKVTATAGTGGSLTLENYDDATVSSGTNVPVLTVIKPTVSVNGGYALKSLKKGSSAIESGSSHTISAATTFTAEFELAGKTVTFNMNGHGGSNITQNVTPGGTATAPDDPTDNLYTFGGWYTDADCTEEFDFSTAINADITLYAKWTPVANKTVYVGVITNSTDITSGVTDVYYWNNDGFTGSAALTSENVSKSYKITGTWSSAQTYNIYSVQIPETATGFKVRTTNDGGSNYTWSEEEMALSTASADGKVVLYYDYSGRHEVLATLYATVYWKNDSTTLKTESINVGTTPSYSGTAPTKTNSTFSGWSPTPAAITTANALSSSGVTYSAQFTANAQYTVTFNANGHGTAPTAQTVYSGNKATEPAAPTATGYRFDGWYTSASGGTQFNFNTAITANTTLYAHWTAIYTVSVASSPAAGGTTTASATEVAQGGTVTLTAAAKECYRFTGWTITGTYTGGSTSSATTTITPSTNITATANYSANASNIVFATGGNGTVTNAGSTSVTYPSTKSSTATPADGYNFTGWTITGGTQNTDYKITSGSASSASITIQPIANGKTITATANFAIKTYTVTFNNGGHGTAPSSQTVNHGSTATKPADLTATNYTFLGWYTAANGTTKYDFSTPITANTTVYAKWAKDVYLRGTFNSWTDINKMEYNEANGTYTVVIPNLSGSISFKAYTPANSSPWCHSGNNHTESLTGTATVSFIYNPNNDTYTVTPVYGTANITVTQTNGTGTVQVTTSDKGGTVTTASGSVEVYQGVTASVTVTAPDGKYIASIGGTAGCSATNVTSYTGTTASVTSAGGTITVTYANNPKVTVAQTGGTGTVKVNNTTVTNNISVGYGTKPTVSITAPTGDYYIASVTIQGNSVYSGTDITKKTFSATFANNVIADETVNVTYGAITKRTITILSYGSTGGTLKFGDTVIPASGGTVQVYDGADAVFTAIPANGYGVQYWVLNTVTKHHDNTFTITNVTDDNNVLQVSFKKLTNFTVKVDAFPGGAGYVESTYKGTTVRDHTSNDTLTITEYDTVTITERHNANDTMKLYDFVGWTIDGSYNVISGDLGSAPITIEPKSNVTVTGNYQLAYRYIYLLNSANWSNCYAHYWNKDGDLDGGWPGTQMDHISGTLYKVKVPLNAAQIIFHNGSGTQTASLTLGTQNRYDNASGKWDTHIDTGYYLVGKCNGQTYEPSNLKRLISNGDGTYSYTIRVSHSYDGYIYVNVCNEKSEIWNAATNYKTDNPQTLVATGQWKTYDQRYKIKLRVNPDDPDGNYDVTVTFNPTSGLFSWTVVESTETVQVNGYNGSKQNQSDTDAANKGYMGNTYFVSSEDATVSTVQKVDHQEAQVKPGDPVNIYTQVAQSESTGTWNYRVDGWVINGTEYEKAKYLGDGLYTGTYAFTEDVNNVVPVYFHTDAWLKQHDVNLIQIYAVADSDTDIWNEWMGCYSWYKVGSTNVYEQFGSWSGNDQGQLMIPVMGLDGVFTTYIEDKDPNGVPVNGVTFNNYIFESIGDVQAYDYYEFKTLLDAGKANLTFVLKSHNTIYNNDRVSENTNINLSNFTFTEFVDYDEHKTDIYGNIIDSTWNSLSDSNALYIVRAGDKPYNTAPLDGQWYVDCYFYNASGQYLGKCISYEVKDPNSSIWGTIGRYAGQRVYVSYESENNTRYDGQWYGDASVSATVTPSVEVAHSTDDNGATHVVSGILPVNVDDYGTAYINGKYQKLEITRGQMFEISATPKAGYKFLGWYTEEDKLFSKELSISLMAATGGKYTAVFQPLAAGEFNVNHYIYNGVGTSAYVPKAHKGEAQLYIGITNDTKGTSTAYSKCQSAVINATEGDVLTITIGTNATGADKFFAWYVDAKDKYGLTTYEEVGVDTEENIWDNNGSVVGRNDEVRFQFKYTVGTDMSLNIYSDLVPVAVDVMLIYNYENRYGNVESYYVPYTLTKNEIDGFEGNGNKKYTPAYISGATWTNTVLANSPFVEDYYRDAIWTINSSMYDPLTFELWATQTVRKFTVTLEYENMILVQQVPFNEVFMADIKKINPANTSRGYWYSEINGVETIIGNTMQIAYRVTQDLTLRFVPVDDMDFDVSIETPVYGREQATDKNGKVTKDIVYIDYMTNVLVPYYPNGTDEHGNTFTENFFDGKPITDGLQHSACTVETLEHYGYTVSYGLVLEQVGSYKVTEGGTYTTFAAAEAKAQTVGYGTATNKATIAGYLKNNQTGMQNGKYYTFVDGTSSPLTNKNRALITLTLNNTEGNRAKFYNVYGYVAVTYDNVTTYYVSNVQTLNIYNAGTHDSVTL